jgi:DNA-binding MarR family transcriptional regulator
MGNDRRLTDAQYGRLLEFRTGLRRFLRWSEEQAAGVGLTSAQHQLLLAIRGHPGGQDPTVGEVADHLLLRHHSAVGLIDRAVASGLVLRVGDAADHRQVRLRMTPLGTHRLETLTALHLEELSRLGSTLRPLWDGLEATPIGRV